MPFRDEQGFRQGVPSFVDAYNRVLELIATTGLDRPDRVVAALPAHSRAAALPVDVEVEALRRRGEAEPEQGRRQREPAQPRDRERRQQQSCR